MVRAAFLADAASGRVIVRSGGGGLPFRTRNEYLCISPLLVVDCGQVYPSRGAPTSKIAHASSNSSRNRVRSASTTMHGGMISGFAYRRFFDFCPTTCATIHAQPPREAHDQLST